MEIKQVQSLILFALLIAIGLWIAHRTAGRDEQIIWMLPFPVAFLFNRFALVLIAVIFFAGWVGSAQKNAESRTGNTHSQANIKTREAIQSPQKHSRTGKTNPEQVARSKE